MATFKKSFLISEYQELKNDERALAAAIGNAEDAVAVVRFQFSSEGDVLFGTCGSEQEMNDYMKFHNANIVWQR